MTSSIRPFWPPLVAGAALGAVLFATYLFTGHGLGASGAVTGATAWIGGQAAPAAARANGYFGPMLEGNPLATWITWELLGVMIGALLSAYASGRFRVRVDGATRFGAGGRLGLALAGGVLSGFGARLARGCTSGLALSGGAPLAVAAFVFLIGFFLVGLAVGYLTRRAWA